MKDVSLLVWAALGLFAVLGLYRMALIFIRWFDDKLNAKVSSLYKFMEPPAQPSPPASDDLAAKISEAVLGIMQPKLADTNHTGQKDLARLIEISIKQTELLRSIADSNMENFRVMKRLLRYLAGAGYEDVTDPRASEIERISQLMDQYPELSRQEAAERIRSQKAYSRDTLFGRDRG